MNEHKTGRKCDNKKCGGDLHDTIINFDETLRKADVQTGMVQGLAADLMLCLGSSLRVQPANIMAANTALRGGNVVIVNLQKTPLSEKGLHIYTKIDDVMELLMKKLDIAIPEFRLHRHAQFKLIRTPMQATGVLDASGVDPSGSPY